jgi:hypothetical protein
MCGRREMCEKIEEIRWERRYDSRWLKEAA